jgi:Mg-chelatase subunit ChlD
MTPQWLLLLPFLFGIIIYCARRNKRQQKFQRNFFAVVRCLVCTLVVLSMCGTTVAKNSAITTTMLVADYSESTKESQEKMEKFLAQVNGAKGAKDWMGMVCFGQNASVENVPAKDAMPKGKVSSYIDGSGTDLQTALSVAANAIPNHTRKRMVLLSDGYQTEGDALAQARILKAQGIKVDVVPLERPKREEVQLSQLSLAQYIHTNTEYDITVTVDATVDTSIHVKLYKGNDMIADEEVEVTAGENKIVFDDKTETGGSVLYRAEVISEKDTIRKNNKAYAYTYITDVPKILLVEKDGSGEQWKTLLENAQVNVTTVSAEGMPTGMDYLGLYDGIILANVSIKDMPKESVDKLKNYVKDLGGGLLVCGGENSYALGEYQNTPLEEILPVDMKLRSEGEEPSLGMVLVIDRSGSMTESQYGISKLELAKEAAIRSLDSFKPQDELGVIAFDDQPQWAVEMQQVEQGKQAIEQGIGMIQAGGGTSILPALQEAHRVLSGSNTKQKHILLLTDGQAEQSGYSQLIGYMKQSGITLSTVAVGSGADTKLLEQLAKEGNGRYYFTNEFTDLPEIFAKETLLAGKDYIKNRTFYPAVEADSPILDGITEVAQLDGYIGTSAKARADVLLKSDTEEPILATWQFGLGRSAAWTSDMEGKWTAKWLSSREGSTIVRNTLSWVMKKQADASIETKAERENGGCRLTISMPYDKNLDALEAIIFSAEGEKQKVALAMESPGIYSALLKEAEEGAYLVNLQMKQKDGTTQWKQTGFHLPFPKEYDIRFYEKGEDLLLKIAQTTGGQILRKGEDVFLQEAEDLHTGTDISDLFLILGGILFLMDIAFHKFTVVMLKLQAAVTNILQRFAKMKTREPKSPKSTTPVVKAKEKAGEKKKDEILGSSKSEQKRPETLEKLLDAKKKRNK